MNDIIPRPRRRPGWKSTVLATAGILVAMAMMLLFRVATKTTPRQPADREGAARQEPKVEPIDPNAIRKKAWARIQPLLDKADQESAAQIEQATSEIDGFFNKSKRGAPALAKEMLSFEGKWATIKSQIARLWSRLPLAEPDADVKLMNDKFAEYIFKPDDAKPQIEGAIVGYVQRLNAIENRLLIRIRADLSEMDLPAAQLITAINSDQALRQEYNGLVNDVTTKMSHEFAFGGGRELTILVGSEIATKIVVHVASAIGTRIGIVAVGTAASWATFGAGLVVAIAVDWIFDKVAELAGHNDEKAITDKIEEALEQMRANFVDGVPEARDVYQRLLTLDRQKGSEEAHRAYRDAANSIERSGNLGIRFDLQHLHDVRKQLRRSALERLVAGKESAL